MRYMSVIVLFIEPIRHSAGNNQYFPSFNPSYLDRDYFMSFVQLRGLIEKLAICNRN